MKLYNVLTKDVVPALVCTVQYYHVHLPMISYIKGANSGQ